LRSIHDMLKPFFAIALPAMLTQMATPFGNYLLTGLIAGFGDSAVAAWAVVGRLTVVAFGGIFSLSGAIAGIFSQNYGAGLYHRVRATYRDALIFCALYSCVMWGILMLASQK
jgi:Na+-driven multidrug efflux pump